MVNTVSEQYAKEVIQEKFGQGLHDILKRKYEEKRFYGIVNGIDYNEYNPKTDPGLKANYDYDSLEKKVINKRHLQRQFKLGVDGDVPVIAMATRITEQKGFDLIIEIIDALLRLDMQLILVGNADSYYRKIFKKLSKKNSKKVATHLEFETKRITRVYAGSDMFLMPSRFEPCGLGQMISLRYGSIPIVRETGGLSDTITDHNPAVEKGNGFVFKTYDPKDLLVAIARALETYKYKDVWARLVKRGMMQSFSWEVPAKKYLLLYKRTLSKALSKKEKMFTYKTIKDIDRKIEKLAEKENFEITKPVSDFIKKGKRFYACSVIKDGRKIFLKARIIDDYGSVYGLKKEAEITKMITRNKKISDSFNFTKYIKSSFKNPPEWYMHEYVEGKLWGVFYDMPKENEKTVYIKIAIENLRNLQSVSEVFIKEAEKNGIIRDIKRRDYGDYKAAIDFYRKEKTGNGKIDFKAVYELLEKSKNLLNENLVVAHGDFKLDNNIIGKDGKIYLSDWESVKIDNVAADVTHLWVQTWRYKDWRSKLLKEFIRNLSKKEKDYFYDVFRITAMEQAMAEIRWNSVLCEKKYKKGVIDISLKTIKNSLKGFDFLLDI
jgi:aminoglycoside phosphotransferase (APT) family kinase protein